MPRLFRLDASIFPDGSTTRAVADRAEEGIIAALPSGDEPLTVVRRDIGREPLPSTAWASALIAGAIPDDLRTREQRDAVTLGATLRDELVRADAYLFAVPLYNWGVSQHVKTWVDLITTDASFGPGSRPIAGRPGILVVARGGNYGVGTPRDGWDHATPWYTRIFRDVWGLDLQTIEVELTLAPTRDYLAEFLDRAAESRRLGLAQASDLGASLAGRLQAAVAA